MTKCRMWGDRVDVITCAIFGDCRLRGVGVVRGVSLPFPIDLTRHPYNTDHSVLQMRNALHHWVFPTINSRSSLGISRVLCAVGRVPSCGTFRRYRYVQNLT